ncbi:hypothetical protein BH20ACT5_BH20ACT5_20040 [soil metagenome]
MYLVLHFDVTDPEEFLAEARTALRALAARPGYRDGRVGRSLDEQSVWLLLSEWDGVGADRRALSADDVKVHATPLLTRARNEPSAFETVLYGDGREVPSDRAEEGPGGG